MNCIFGILLIINFITFVLQEDIILKILNFVAANLSLGAILLDEEDKENVIVK